MTSQPIWLTDVEGISCEGSTGAYSIRFRIKKVGTTTWGNWTYLNDNTLTSFTADNQYAWDLQVELEDALNSTQTYTINKALDVGTPIVFYDVVQRSVGINALPEARNILQVEGDIVLNGEFLSNLIVYDAVLNTDSGYIRFANGFMISWTSKSATAGGSAWGSMYYSDITMGNWAMPFTTLITTIPSSDSALYTLAITSSTNTNAGMVRATRPNNGTATIKVKVVGIGTWR